MDFLIRCFRPISKHTYRLTKIYNKNLTNSHPEVNPPNPGELNQTKPSEKPQSIHRVNPVDIPNQLTELAAAPLERDCRSPIFAQRFCVLLVWSPPQRGWLADPSKRTNWFMQSSFAWSDGMAKVFSEFGTCRKSCILLYDRVTRHFVIFLVSWSFWMVKIYIIVIIEFWNFYSDEKRRLSLWKRSQLHLLFWGVTPSRESKASSATNFHTRVPLIKLYEGRWWATSELLPREEGSNASHFLIRTETDEGDRPRLFSAPRTKNHTRISKQLRTQKQVSLTPPPRVWLRPGIYLHS